MMNASAPFPTKRDDVNPRSVMDETCLAGAALAMVYSPPQAWGATYDPALGLERGTIFPELDKPWIGGDICDDN